MTVVTLIAHAAPSQALDDAGKTARSGRTFKSPHPVLVPRDGAPEDEER